MPSPSPTATLHTTTLPTTTLPTTPVATVRPGRDAPRVLPALVLGATAALVLAATYVLGVVDPGGRRLDDAVMRAAMRSGAGLRPALETLLDVVAVPTVTLAVLALVALALARGRGRLAAGVVALVLGSQLGTQVLKAVLPRVGDAEGNSLPSGHMTLVVALGVALVVVLPRALRPVSVVVATAGAALVGVATMVAGWHRPSDLVAAVAVVAGTAALLGLVGTRSRPAQPGVSGARASTTWSR